MEPKLKLKNKLDYSEWASQLKWHVDGTHRHVEEALRDQVERVTSFYAQN
jgi:hypothetical protein